MNTPTTTPRTDAATYPAEWLARAAIDAAMKEGAN